VTWGHGEILEARRLRGSVDQIDPSIKGSSKGEPDNVLGCMITAAYIPVSGLHLSARFVLGGGWQAWVAGGGCFGSVIDSAIDAALDSALNTVRGNSIRLKAGGGRV
jgi:hypothetical protein